MSWRLSGNLAAIRQSVWNKYGRVTVGTIGDQSHKNTSSDHNPDGRGIVCAIDVMLGVGAKASAIVRAAVGRSDLAYVIHNRTIWSASRGWKAARYTGSDPHTNHVHISSKHTAAADQRHVGLNLGAAPAPQPSPTPGVPPFPGEQHVGSHGQPVMDIQYRLNARGYPHLNVDGNYGPQTADRVRRFQRYARIQVDGRTGKITWNRLWSLPIS